MKTMQGFFHGQERGEEIHCAFLKISVDDPGLRTRARSVHDLEPSHFNK